MDNNATRRFIIFVIEAVALISGCIGIFVFMTGWQTIFEIPLSAPTPNRQSEATKKPTPTISQPENTPDSPTPTRKSPTATFQPSTPTPIPISMPIVSCATEAQGVFRNLWIKYKHRLGCPNRAEPVDGFFAEQPFQNGHMFWSKSAKLYIITVGDSSGNWLLYEEDESPWKEGMPNVICDEQVIRGFGGLWCSNSPIREQLGRPLDKEQGFDGLGLIQGFDGGVIFRDSDGKTRGLAYVLFYDDSSFIREPY